LRQARRFPPVRPLPGNDTPTSLPFRLVTYDALLKVLSSLFPNLVSSKYMSRDNGAARAPRFEGEDVSPTTERELRGWYSTGLAAEIYAVCGVGRQLFDLDVPEQH
jgi:hypothetical protein